jgi:elongation factor G
LDALSKISLEDPSFSYKFDEESGQTLISGMGELHLDIVVDRLLRDYKVEANIGKPEVAYRETVMVTAQYESRICKEIAGRNHFAHVVIKISPLKRGEGIKFVNSVPTGKIPMLFIKACEQGIREALDNGVLAGYPVIDVRIDIIDGSHNEIESSELAFKIAGSLGFREACLSAKPVLMEPIMETDVVTPQEFMGDIIGDINSRRGKVLRMDVRNNCQVIRLLTHLREMFGYAKVLRSASQGRASYTMLFNCYDCAPKHVSDEVISRVRGY